MMLERRKNLNINDFDIHDYLSILNKNKLVMIVFVICCIFATTLFSILQDEASL